MEKFFDWLINFMLTVLIIVISLMGIIVAFTVALIKGRGYIEPVSDEFVICMEKFTKIIDNLTEEDSKEEA